MDLKFKVTKLLDRANQLEQNFANDLSDEQRSVIGTHDHWSAKDVLAHIATWKWRLSNYLLTVSQGEIPVRSEDFEKENAKIFVECRTQTWDDVLALMEHGYSSLLESLDLDVSADLESLAVLPWQDDRPLWRLIVSIGYSHPVFHLASLYTEFGDIERANKLHKEIEASLSELDDDPVWIGIIRYNLACHYSLNMETDKAISLLREALSLNPELIDWSKEDPDFEPIRDDPGYLALYSDIK